MSSKAVPPLTGGNRPYQITTVAKTAHQDVEVTVQGPGIGPAGQRYAFATLKRAETFVNALNSAFTQGVTEGLKIAQMGGNPAVG